MFCPKCGTQNPDNARFCQECGEKLRPTASSKKKSGEGRKKSSGSPEGKSYGKQPKKNKKSSGRKTSEMIVVDIVLLILLGVLVRQLFLGGSEDTAQRSLETSEEAEEFSTASELYSILSQYTFDYSSGVGAWATSLLIEEDGTFSGQFYDEDSGESGSGYSSQVSVCNFSGSFGEPVMNDDGSYTLPLNSLVYEEEEGSSYIINETLYEFSAAYGMVNTDSLVLYMTGAEEADLPSGLIDWCSSHDALSDGVLTKYAIYNESEDTAFFGETYAYSAISVPE